MEKVIVEFFEKKTNKLIAGFIYYPGDDKRGAPIFLGECVTEATRQFWNQYRGKKLASIQIRVE